MQQPTQARTNHLGYDAGSSRKIPGGAIAIACPAPIECLKAGNPNAFTLVAVAVFRFLCLAYSTVKAAFKATALAPTFQIQVKVDGATVMLDAGSAWTAADVKAALHTKTGRASGGYYLVAGGGKPLNDSAATTLAALGVGPGDQLELRGRLRGGMPSQEDIRAAFALYDTNGDGQLSPDELKAIMCKAVPGGTARTEEEVDALVKKFDADGDGMLSMEEIAGAWAEIPIEETVKAATEAPETEGEKAAAEILAEPATEENAAEAPAVAAMAGYCVTLIEVPAVEGKAEEMFKLFVEHPMGLAYAASQPGFVSMDVAIDTEKNSVVIFGKWSKADDWRAYAATREVENEANAGWTAAFGPLVGGAPRMMPMDCRKNYAGSAPAAEDGSYGIALVEVPAAEGKLEEMCKHFIEHPMGGAYTASQPGFLSMDVAIDTEKNSLLFYSH